MNGSPTGATSSQSACSGANATVIAPAARAAAIATDRSGSSPNAITMSSAPAASLTSVASGAESPTSPSAGSARLPTITGCTNSTATWRTSDRAVGETPIASSRPPRANRSAIA